MWGEHGVVSYVENQRERMVQVHEFKYLGCRVNNKGTEKVNCEKSNEWEEAIKALVNERGLKFELVKVIDETF